MTVAKQNYTEHKQVIPLDLADLSSSVLTVCHRIAHKEISPWWQSVDNTSINLYFIGLGVHHIHRRDRIVMFVSTACLYLS